MPKRCLALALAVSCLATTACTTQEFVNGALQAVYNSGRYACTQIRNCDVPPNDTGAAAAVNRH
jgi:hypothetical protein